MQKEGLVGVRVSKMRSSVVGVVFMLDLVSMM